MPGGLGDTRPADGHVQDLCDAVCDAAEKQLQATGWNGIFQKCVAKSYASQIVAGTNYFVKVDVGSEHYIHLRIYESLPAMNEDPALAGVKQAKKDDPIEFF